MVDRFRVIADIVFCRNIFTKLKNVACVKIEAKKYQMKHQPKRLFADKNTCMLECIIVNNTNKAYSQLYK